MRIIFNCILVQLILLMSSSASAQLGIAPTNLDGLSILDASSTNKSLLMPRLTTAQRDLTESLATGLIIYNTTLNDGQLNTGTPSGSVWTVIKQPEVPIIYSVSEGGDISITSKNNLLVTGIIVSPSLGTYVALFNTQMSGSITTVTTQTLGSDQVVIDLINGASTNTLFWVCETTLSTFTGVNTTIKGILVSPAGAVSLGINTNLKVSMFTKSGTLSMGTDCIITTSSGSSNIDLGLLSKFGMFSSNGVVLDAANFTITGSVGTASKSITFVGMHNGIKYPAGAVAENVLISTTNVTTYNIFLNGLEVAHSSRTINLVSSIVS